MMEERIFSSLAMGSAEVPLALEMDSEEEAGASVDAREEPAAVWDRLLPAALLPETLQPHSDIAKTNANIGTDNLFLIIYSPSCLA